MFIGIDPGLKGGLAYINEDGSSAAFQMPVTAKEIDGHALTEQLKALGPITLAVIEKVHAMPGQGVTSMFKFGKGFGQLIGTLQALEIPFIEVTPQAWKTKILKGTKKDKDAAINYAKNKYPTINLKPGRCRTDQDGLADAICIAEYAKLSK